MRCAQTTVLHAYAASPIASFARQWVESADRVLHRQRVGAAGRMNRLGGVTLGCHRRDQVALNVALGGPKIEALLKQGEHIWGYKGGQLGPKANPFDPERE